MNLTRDYPEGTMARDFQLLHTAWTRLMVHLVWRYIGLWFKHRRVIHKGKR